MTVESTILRVVGYILSLPPEKQAIEQQRLIRYARLYDTQLSDEIKGHIANAEISALYALLFPQVHQAYLADELNTLPTGPRSLQFVDPTSAKEDTSVVETSAQKATDMDKAELAFSGETPSETASEEPKVDSESVNLSDGESDGKAQTGVDAEADVDTLVSTETAQNTAVAEPSAPTTDTEQASQPSTSVAEVEVEAEEWSDALWLRLMKRFRSPRKPKRPKPQRGSRNNSRWEFWHANVGLMPLRRWLEQHFDLLDQEYPTNGADENTSMLIDSAWSPMFQQTIEGLNQGDINTIADIVLRAPVAYQKFPFSSLDRSIVEGETTLRGKVLRRYIEVQAVFKRWVVVLEGKQEVELTCAWTGCPPRGWDKWTMGSMIGFAGELEMEEGLLMRNPEPIGLDGRGSGLLAQYDIDGISDIEIRNLMAHLLQDVLESVQDSLPKEVLDSADVLALEDALREAHFPSNQNYRGRNRFAFEEVFLYHIGKRLNSKFTVINGTANAIEHGALARFAWVNNIQLSDPQEQVLSDIRRDMVSNEPMRRLLQGDVGAGKPMVALFSALSLFELKVQGHPQNEYTKSSKKKNTPRPLVVYVCQDELSAERRFIFVEGAFKMLGLQCKLMTHKPNKAEINILESEGGMVVVTADVLRTRLQSLDNIRLVIVEETEAFGKNIPYGFIKRTPSPDLLVFTPTPQPIHVLETVYSDFALSTLELDDSVLPHSTWVKASDRDAVYTQMLSLVKQGRQGLIIWPVVKGQDSIDVKQALQMAGAIQGRYLPEARIAVYCSSMRKEERLKVFEEFQNKRIDVLLCTTIIEDTPPVGNTTMIIAEKAEMSDIMRLHRLRGHLFNSHYPAFCTYVMSDDASPEAIAQVQKVCDEPDGFALAEWLVADAEGLNLQWAGQESLQIRTHARDLAHQLSLRDLRRCRWPLLNNAVRNWWTDFDVPEQKKVNRHRKSYKRRR